jgi:hypothetical protein
MQRCRDGEMQRCRGTTDTKVQDTATAVGSSAGDAMHRATPPYGWRVLGVYELQLIGTDKD